jgi:hypothetical protein
MVLWINVSYSGIGVLTMPIAISYAGLAGGVIGQHPTTVHHLKDIVNVQPEKRGSRGVPIERLCLPI